MHMLNKKNIVSMPKLITHDTCDDYKMLQRLGDSDQVKFSSKGDELVYLHVYIASYTLPTERVFILD